MADPEIIGEIRCATVLINRESRTVILYHEDMPPITFSIDHPYIQGTKLERDARAAFARSPQERASD